jgi:hypothetical protein
MTGAGADPRFEVRVVEEVLANATRSGRGNQASTRSLTAGSTGSKTL